MTLAGIPGLLKFQLADTANNTGVTALETVTFSGTPTGGTFTVTYSGQGEPYTTGPITLTIGTGVIAASTATATQTALNGLPNAPAGGFTVAATGTGYGLTITPVSYQGPIPSIARTTRWSAYQTGSIQEMCRSWRTISAMRRRTTWPV
ncbi:MAG: hypothetical protein LC748_00035 [Thermomicrobia bacterium]|nr:hypothetical protein [Thermomicrobia bacterium]